MPDNNETRHLVERCARKYLSPPINDYIYVGACSCGELIASSALDAFIAEWYTHLNAAGS